MPILEWQERFNLGIEQFDVHQQPRVMLLNSSYDNFVQGSPVENLGLILNALIDYAIYHFNAEERWMKDNEYLRFDEHRKAHDAFTKRVVEMQTAFVNGEDNISFETLTFLSGWLSNHILESDADFGRFAAKRQRTAEPDYL